LSDLYHLEDAEVFGEAGAEFIYLYLIIYNHYKICGEKRDALVKKGGGIQRNDAM